ncbi:hypothetical protein Ahy_B06g084369 [Arachis hypogaea]|uniref:Transposase MuDR plant domain-containing protein n=1 Tax=Arachis hypogaea TaxID=3818 RepID=A0A444YRP9_ARAHY|nr:hypothetical protein Ahy_B06g084369 [Arachis hypogaea]
MGECNVVVEDEEFSIGINLVLESRLSLQSKAILSLEKLITLCMSRSCKHSSQNARVWYRILTQKKGCWEIRRYNDKHTCTMWTTNSKHIISNITNSSVFQTYNQKSVSIRKYNGKYTCTMGMILQDHTKLDSDTIADAIRLLVEADPLIKKKSIIAEVQFRFNYTIRYRKAWLAK